MALALHEDTISRLHPLHETFQSHGNLASNQALTSAALQNPTMSRLAVSTRPAGSIDGTSEQQRTQRSTICPSQSVLLSRGTAEHTYYLPGSSCAISATSPRAVGRRDLSTTLARILEPSLGESSCVKSLGPRKDGYSTP